ncbi:MAG: c-type cytochrome biogenesis protein CcmI [Rhodospirillaceae bacterium]|nr:c-type cytochrome biogenesis protein CcmI [Rhodospirillaceae bacterium]MBT5308299.1 c-type cytochrome biogenesis protein CcmI [Rhodospirillaceae bacterium]MBT7355292.1 c-type cytochrome biogenesis protein CcmI [Rhodospirillaceae bacterium]
MMPDTLQLWLVMAALSIAVLLYILMPLIRPRGGANAAREAYDINVYKDQLKEVERDLERGLLGDDAAEAARMEIKRRLLAADAAVSKKVKTPEAKSGMVLIVALAVFVPVGAVLMYLDLGSPNAPDQPLAERTASAPAMSQEETKRRTSLANAVASLVEKLKENPGDVRGWTLLGRSHASMEQYGKSAGAYGKAYELSDGDPKIGVSYAEAMAFDARTMIPQKAVEVLGAVLLRDPNDPKARYYMALAKAQKGDGEGAMRDWVNLAVTSGADDPWMGLVNQQIERAAEKFGLNPADFMPTQSAPTFQRPFPQSRPQPSMQSGPSRADMDAAAQMTDEQRQQMIQSMVDGLAERLRKNPDDKQGWLRLERAYRVLGDAAKADDAAARAAKLP